MKEKTKSQLIAVIVVTMLEAVALGIYFAIKTVFK
jgi:hypothetical protein